MALYQDGILISGANTLPKMTLAEYNALPADQRPTYWERLDADYDDVLADKADIATIESGTTASRAYGIGELVYVSGTLYRVKTAIASGATFTVGTNIEPANVSDVVSNIPTINTTLNNLKNRFEGLIEVPASVTTAKLFCYNVAVAVANMSDGSTVVKNAVWAGQDYYLFVATRWGDIITGILSNRASILSFAYVRSTGEVYGIKITGTAL